MKELKNLKELVETIHGLYTSYEDINLLIEMGYEDEDPAMVKELEEEIHTFEKVFEKLKIQTLLSGEYDACNAIMTIHAGAGGTESCDWAVIPYVLPLGREKRILASGAGFPGWRYRRD